MSGASSFDDAITPSASSSARRSRVYGVRSDAPSARGRNPLPLPAGFAALTFLDDDGSSLDMRKFDTWSRAAPETKIMRNKKTKRSSGPSGPSKTPAQRAAGGLTRLNAVWLSPEAEERREELTALTGSIREAIEYALLNAPLPTKK